MNYIFFNRAIEVKIGSERHKVTGFDPNKCTFLESLGFMLQLFYEGTCAEEIMALFNNQNIPLLLSFVQEVVGGDIPTTVRDQLNRKEQREAEDGINFELSVFDLVLHLHHISESIWFVQDELKQGGYQVPETLIRGLIFYQRQWRARMLSEARKEETYWYCPKYSVDTVPSNPVRTPLSE